MAEGSARVLFAPMRTSGKRSLVTRSGSLLDRAGLRDAVAADDLVAVKLHFGEQGNTGFVQPVFLREIVARVKAAGGKPFLTDANTLYRGQRSNAVDHLGCALHNGFCYATVEAPVVIADGIDGRDGVDVNDHGRHALRLRARRRRGSPRRRDGGRHALQGARGHGLRRGAQERRHGSRHAFGQAADARGLPPARDRREVHRLRPVRQVVSRAGDTR